jgi:hypothetical protein
VCRVGLVWGGNPKPNPRRSCPLSAFAPLARVPGVAFYRLQNGDAAQQSPPPGLDLIDLTVGLTDFADTAALIANLDLVIAIDTGVAHLAGAVGNAAVRPRLALNRGNMRNQRNVRSCIRTADFWLILALVAQRGG